MYLVQKQVGETPLMALQRLRAEKGLPPDVPLSYAGRLDPMASGALLVLEGAECQDQKRFMGLDKEYRVEVLLGAHSDTGDILGLVASDTAPQVSLSALQEASRGLIGPYNAPYPLFSSRTVQGKQLFQWTLEGRAHEIEIPLQHGSIQSLTVDAIRSISAQDLKAAIETKLELVPLTTDVRKALGKNFRIDAVRESWDAFFASAPESFQIATFTTRTSSGVYMRTLADDLAMRVGSRGLAFSIHRLQIFLP